MNIELNIDNLDSSSIYIYVFIIYDIIITSITSIAIITIITFIIIIIYIYIYIYSDHMHMMYINIHIIIYIHGLIDWLIDWLVDWLVGWLIDWEPFSSKLANHGSCWLQAGPWISTEAEAVCFLLWPLIGASESWVTGKLQENDRRESCHSKGPYLFTRFIYIYIYI